MTAKTMHGSVLILFLVAITLYFLGMAISAMFFGLLGMVVEAIAWATWLVQSRKPEEEK